MEIWEIKLWEMNPSIPKGKDTLVISKEHSEYDRYMDLEAHLQRIIEKHPEMGAEREGTNLTIPSEKVPQAIEILYQYSIDHRNINMDGYLKRDCAACAF